MDSFLLCFLTLWTQKPSPCCCCWQLSPGSVSPLLGIAFLLRVNSLFYSLSGLAGREEQGGGEVLWGHGERERALERAKERERSEVSIQECAWASLGLTQPRWLGGNPWQRETGEPRSTPPALSLSLTAPLLLPSRLSRPFSQSVFVSSARATASLSAIKTLYNQRGTVMGKQAYVRLVEYGKQQNPLLHISAAAGRVQPKSPVISTVSNLNSENPPDSKFERLFTMTHQLLLHRIWRVLCGAERRAFAHGPVSSRRLTSNRLCRINNIPVMCRFHYQVQMLVVLIAKKTKNIKLALCCLLTTKCTISS